MHTNPNASPDLEGVTVVVTGAGRGIGAAIVQHLLRAKASVLALVQAESDFQRLTQSERLKVRVVDVLKTEDVSGAVQAAAELFGGTRVLINNAGVINPIGLLGCVDADAWARVLAVNAGGAMRCTNAFMPHLLESCGTVINMSSGAAYRPLLGWSAYCASKAALLMVSRATDLEYREQGIRVFSLGIPPTDTDMQAIIRSSGVNEVSKIPQQNLTSPSIVAAVVTWLCSPGARAAIEKIEIDVRDPEFAIFREGAV